MIWAFLVIACTGGTTPVGDVVVPPAQPAGEHQPLLQPGKLSGPAAPDSPISPDDCTRIEGTPMDADGISGTLTCGQTLVAQTRGGTTRFGTRFYEKNYCTPATTNHDGGDERIYRFDMPKGPAKAWLTLDTPCGNLDLSAMKAKEGAIPNGEADLLQCEMNVKDGHTREKVELNILEATTWWVVVEGAGDEEGVFALHVQCEE